MDWALYHIKNLQEGKTVEFRPKGESMSGKIDSGDLVTVVPLDKDPEVGDIVLCKVNGRSYLHIVKAIKRGQFQIGNNRGFINGWTSRKNIFGKCIRITK